MHGECVRSKIQSARAKTSRIKALQELRTVEKVEFMQVMRLRFRCDESVSRTNDKLFSSDFLLYLPPLVSDNT